MPPPGASQREIDSALRKRGLMTTTVPLAGARLVAKNVLKLASVAVAGAAVVVGALFHYWFAQVSDLPTRYTPRWYEHVESHIKDSATGYGRLTSVETKVSGLETSVDHLHDEVKDMRADQLEFYRWQAERAGDMARARMFGERLRQVK